MRILSSATTMQSHHSIHITQQHQARLSLWSSKPETPDQSTMKPWPIATAEKKLPTHRQDDTITTDDHHDKQLPPDLLKMKRAIESLMAWLSGHIVKMDIFSEDDLALHKTSAPPTTEGTTPTQSTPSTNTWGAIYQQHDHYQETEHLSVKMQGAVNTADGRNIRFDLSMALSRHYATESTVEMRAGAALKDPLIINFDGQPAQLSLNKINFDLSTKGTPTESITQLNDGSGYLAIDRNANGMIDNGSELFGPQSNHGFGELAQLDSDGNGWIDEADTAFSALRIWQPKSDGTQTLMGMAQLGIGAINTRGVDANFNYKDSSNQQQGQMKQAGVFLFENGRAGSLQQIDLAA